MRELIEQAEGLRSELDSLRDERTQARAKVTASAKLCGDTRDLLKKLEEQLLNAKLHEEDLTNKIAGIKQDVDALEKDYAETAEELREEFAGTVSEIREDLTDSAKDDAIE